MRTLIWPLSRPVPATGSALCRRCWRPAGSGNGVRDGFGARRRTPRRCWRYSKRRCPRGAWARAMTPVLPGPPVYRDIPARPHPRTPVLRGPPPPFGTVGRGTCHAPPATSH